MVTGKRAFERDSTAATLAAILKEEPKPPGELAGGLPPDLEKVLTRCLRKDPARRFQHMDDLKVTLEELKEAADSRALETAGGAARPKGFQLPWAAGLALLLAAAVAGVWIVRFRAPAPEAALVPVPPNQLSRNRGQFPAFSQTVHRWPFNGVRKEGMPDLCYTSGKNIKFAPLRIDATINFAGSSFTPKA